MVAKDFYYNGSLLSDFDLIMAAPDTEDISGLDRTILKGETTTRRTTANHYGTTYDGVIELKFLFIKNPCKKNALSGDKFTINEYRKVVTWLTEKSLPAPMTIMNNNIDHVEVHGVFTSISPYIQNGVNGFYATFTCNSPYGFVKITKEFNFPADGTEHSIEIYCDSDEPNKWMNPVIKIEEYDYDAEKASFKIQYIDAYTEEWNISSDVWMVDSEYKRVLSMFGQALPLYYAFNIDEEDYSINNLMWPRVYNGKNKIYFTGILKGSVEIKVPVKIGGYIDVI